MMKHSLSLPFLMLWVQLGALGQTEENSFRTKKNINENWEYLENPTKDITQALKIGD